MHSYLYINVLICPCVQGIGRVEQCGLIPVPRFEKVRVRSNNVPTDYQSSFQKKFSREQRFTVPPSIEPLTTYVFSLLRIQRRL